MSSNCNNAIHSLYQKKDVSSDLFCLPITESCLTGDAKAAGFEIRLETEAPKAGLALSLE